jgi:hypothetical protein
MHINFDDQNVSGKLSWSVYYRIAGYFREVQFISFCGLFITTAKIKIGNYNDTLTMGKCYHRGTNSTINHLCADTLTMGKWYHRGTNSTINHICADTLTMGKCYHRGTNSTINHLCADTLTMGKCYHRGTNSTTTKDLKVKSFKSL